MDCLSIYLRRLALSLMLLLSVAASCTSDSYDDNPYDDTPPVTVDFNFVKPQVVTAPAVQNELSKTLVSSVAALEQPSLETRLVLDFVITDSRPRNMVSFVTPLRT
jgi:hypothetical protein